MILKIHEGQTRYGAYNGIGIEYSNYPVILNKGNFIDNFYIDPIYISKNDLKKKVNVIFISQGCTGKSSLIGRLIKNTFNEYLCNVGIDYSVLRFMQNDKVSASTF